MNRTDEPGAGSVPRDPVGPRARRPALDLRAHAPTVHPMAMRWPSAGNIRGMSHLAAEPAASARSRWRRRYLTSRARPTRGFDGGRGA